jgi:gamma-glutamylcyclotransferase (GGCT)/AIG2-like uncharacterized protein YtfP
MTDASLNDLLFVYGTLRRASDHPLAGLLADKAKWLGFAEFRGLLFSIGPYPGAVPSDDSAHRIRGEVYRLTDPATILPLLDSYEEFGEDFPEPNEFIRVRQTVRLNGNPVEAWIYLYNHSTDNLALLGHDYFSETQD